MEQWKFTTIQHAGRKALNLTPNEYTVLDLIFKMQTYPKAPRPGWCIAGVRYFADIMLFGTGGIAKMLSRFERDGLIEYDPNDKRAKKTTPKFYDIAYLDDEKAVHLVNKSVHLVNKSVHLVNKKRSLSEQVYNSNESIRNIESAPAQNQKPALSSTPDWQDVARQMLEYSKGEGAAQYRFLAETMRFTGDPTPVFVNWAGQASPYQLNNWKREFPKLGNWFRTENRILNGERANKNHHPTSPPVKISWEV